MCCGSNQADVCYGLWVSLGGGGGGMGRLQQFVKISETKETFVAVRQSLSPARRERVQRRHTAQHVREGEQITHGGEKDWSGEEREVKKRFSDVKVLSRVLQIEMPACNTST